MDDNLVIVFMGKLLSQVQLEQQGRPVSLWKLSRLTPLAQVNATST